MRNGKIKFIFNREAKRVMGLLLPGGPLAELQNLLEFIICWNEAASGNKPPVAVADGAGDRAWDYSLPWSPVPARITPR